MSKEMETNISYVNASSSQAMLNQLTQLKIANYNYTADTVGESPRLGLIAEDTAQIAPELLSSNGKGIDLYKLVTFTLSGVQQLAINQQSLALRVTSLENRLTELENGSISTSSGTPDIFSTSTLANALASFGVFIQNGITQFHTLVADQFVAATDSAGNSSAGSGTITAGNTVTQITNAYAQPTSEIFITFTSPITGNWYLSNKGTGQFSVSLAQAQTTDVSFDYFIVETKGQIATSTPQTNSGTSTVVGTSAPLTITLIGPNPATVPIGGVFTDPGVTVTDGVDGTDPVTTFVDGKQEGVNPASLYTGVPTTHIITYSVTDSTGVTVTKTRAVVVTDSQTTTPTSTGNSGSSTPSTTSTSTPVVTLNGGAAAQLTVGDTWTDPGATATDTVDGNLTSAIVETGSVDTTTAGVYTLIYSATDSAGNTGTASRVVSVVAPDTSDASSTPSP